MVVAIVRGSLGDVLGKLKLFPPLGMLGGAGLVICYPGAAFSPPARTPLGRIVGTAQGEIFVCMTRCVRYWAG